VPPPPKTRKKKPQHKREYISSPTLNTHMARNNQTTSRRQGPADHTARPRELSPGLLFLVLARVNRRRVCSITPSRSADTSRPRSTYGLRRPACGARGGVGRS